MITYARNLYSFEIEPRKLANSRSIKFHIYVLNRKRKRAIERGIESYDLATAVEKRERGWSIARWREVRRASDGGSGDGRRGEPP